MKETKPTYEDIDIIEEREKRERMNSFSKIWWKSRAVAGVSQEYIANELGISRKTVQNWERGISSPTLFQGAEWFRVLGMNPMPYYFGYLYPETMDGIKASDDDKKIESALTELVNNLTMENKRRLLYLLYGNHGSSPNSVINLVNAHLQTPINDRIMAANMILSNYELEAEMNNLVRPENIQPDTKLLHESIMQAKTAVIKKQKGYIVPTEEK